MVQASKYKNYLKYAFIISILLHIILISLFSMYSRIQDSKLSYDNRYESNEVIINYDNNIQLHNKQRQYFIDKNYQIETQYMNKQEKNKTILYIKKNEKYLPFKKIIKEEKQIINNVKQTATNNKKQIINNVKQTATNNKKQIINNVKQTATNNKKQIINNVKQTATNNKKQIINNVKQTQLINSLFDQLLNNKYIDKDINNKITDKYNSKNNVTLNSDIIKYAKQIQMAITSNFHTDPIFNGKICNLRIKLASNGMLLSIVSEGGSPVLCQAAIAAAKMTKYPKPPNNSIYQIFKNSFIEFQPN
ncbi:cell envelope integrity protein TolA [Candidatus Profftia lariciata]|uniref:cell envelope integrity protein TolA n=1 Tax=Candidatus Profftia lariciata TaxID=1987921 RepID=UPI001D01D9D8|nr:cell envelope integrity protein TolA [Candidatus Profftia lariciata]